MKIIEILDADNNHQDLLDLLKLETLPKIDKFIDNILYISNNFNVPVEFLNHDRVSEFLDISREIQHNLMILKFPEQSRWVINVERIISYLTYKT